MGRTRFLTSESVTEGHPDKVADQISDGVLDAVMASDPQKGRVACETLLTTGMALVAGEITTDSYIDVRGIVRQVVKDIGYTRADYGFSYKTCAVLVSIGEQSPDIAMGVDPGGAGDQGMMFGYATRETPVLMPLPITLAHRLTSRLAEVRKKGILSYLRPDGKSQVTVEYEGPTPVRVDTVVIAAQHAPETDQDDMKRDIWEQVVVPSIPEEFMDRLRPITYYMNRTGRFEVGGPQGDTGLTGRKIIADTYGGVGSHGGGAFSGKDPTKVDRSGAYMARYIAKNVVAAGLADHCEIQLAYAIGEPEPISILVNAHGGEEIPEESYVKAIREVFDLRPSGMIDALDLRRPIYRKTAAYGHFGREDSDFTWEICDKVEALRKAVGQRA
ncbi:MAG: methionine adenosyltransferase [Candidatus Eisenbacteria sp.]|nr:methionine adenosyltransferase [Candidatus Eisenbacteria bacterium]